MVHADSHHEDKHEDPVPHMVVRDHTTGEVIKDMSDLRRFGVPRPAYPDEYDPVTWHDRMRRRLFKFWDGPVTWFRKNIVEANRLNPPPVYYHRKYARVPTIDECYEGDFLCYFEAQEQWKRDREVDSEILNILNKRRQHCILYEGDDWAKNCREIHENFMEASTNFFLRYGEVGYFSTVIDAYMRQKHRMIWERRNPDKVDFMYAKDRQGKYVQPMERGQTDSIHFPDNSRTRYLRGLDMTYPQSPTKTSGQLFRDQREVDRIEEEQWQHVKVNNQTYDQPKKKSESEAEH